jgi:D-alanyl-lipoteichoic acid acyltransferase DltB (MBOAT superfamily)
MVRHRSNIAMAFNSLDFCIFLIVMLCITWGLARFRLLRLSILLVASYFFYMCAKKEYIVLILTSTIIDYFCGIWIPKTKTKRGKKALLALSLTTNLGLLGTFKYFDFFMGSIEDFVHYLSQYVSWASPELAMPMLNVALPVGISFYTFQTMAYTIDVYRGRQEPVKNFLQFALFVTFFPQLVAGPIVNAHELVPQFLKPPTVTVQQVSDGLFRILKGLIKKVVIADWLAINLIDPMYANPEFYTPAAVVVALYAYSMQIYCDFSGYTDMAIGSAKLFGYELPENFERPYLATSVSEFWRRWHMTLSRWIRHYIYFPLGGTYKGEFRSYVNIMIVLIAMSFWHGANWTFFWYGIFHGTMVCINRVTRVRRKRAGIKEHSTGWGLVWRIWLSLLFVTLARILFRAPNIDVAIDVWNRLFDLDVGAIQVALSANNWSGVYDQLSAYISVEQIHWKIWAMLGVSYAIHWSPPGWVGKARDAFARSPAIVQGACVAVVAAWMVHLANTQPIPFIYFQF